MKSRCVALFVGVLGLVIGEAARAKRLTWDASASQLLALASQVAGWACLVLLVFGLIDHIFLIRRKARRIEVLDGMLLPIIIFILVVTMPSITGQWPLILLLDAAIALIEVPIILGSAFLFCPQEKSYGR